MGKNTKTALLLTAIAAITFCLVIGKYWLLRG